MRPALQIDTRSLGPEPARCAVRGPRTHERRARRAAPHHAGVIAKTRRPATRLAGVVSNCDTDYVVQQTYRHGRDKKCMGERRNQQEEAHITEESFATNASTKLYLKHTSALLHTLQDQRARSLQGCRQVPTLARGATKNHPKKTESIKHTDGITEIDDILENSGNANMIMRTQMDHEAKFMNLSRAPAHHGTPRRVWCYMWHPKDVATDTSTACRIREATRLLAYRNKQDATKMIRKINIQISRKVKQQIHLKISLIKIQKTGNNIMHTSKCKGSKPLDPNQLRQTGITCINCSADECRPSYASSVLALQ